ncbi:MAG: hypothetical protein KKB51_19545 [Candidatus Riflebacteria bacterium]|nr:hypothetical protein [Candidatus Riflebacteria bacterium]
MEQVCAFCPQIQVPVGKLRVGAGFAVFFDKLAKKIADYFSLCWHIGLAVSIILS